MAYDLKLAERIRRAVAGRDGVTEKQMFGGLAFLLGGKTFCGIVKNDLMVRVGPDRYEESLRRPHARPMDFTGRPLTGYVYVGPEGSRTPRMVTTWVDRGIAFVETNVTGRMRVLLLGGLLAGGMGSALAATAPAAPPEPPKPAAELDALKKLEGRWTCAGEAPAGPMGPGRKYQSTFRYARGLGGFFWLSEYDQAAGKENPAAMAARGFLRWDAGHFAFDAFLNNGATASESVAFDGRTYVVTGEMRAGGQAMGLRETLKLDGDRKMTWTGEIKMGPDYVVIGRDSCRKD